MLNTIYIIKLNSIAHVDSNINKYFCNYDIRKPVTKFIKSLSLTFTVHPVLCMI